MFKSLQMKYNILHILFWISYLSIYGYIAIFLQYKGLTNAEIGVVSGAGALLSMFVSPFISSLISKINGLTIKKMMLILYFIMLVLFVSLVFFDLPIWLIMMMYVALLCLAVSNVPFLSMICMDYLKAGKYVNFGLSRGMGSVAYAVGAVVVSQMISWINPTVIVYVYIIFSLLLLYVLFSMSDTPVSQVPEAKKVSVFTIIKNYRTFFLMLLSFAFVYSASNTISTYLINIIENLGGNTSIYGIAIFFMAASEMPFMAITHNLLKKYKAETLLLAAIFFYLVRNFTICFAPNIVIVLIGMMFQGISFGIFTATIAYYVNDYLKVEDQMMGQTMIAMMSSGLGAAIGNIVGGFLQDYFGIESMFVFIGVMTVIGFVIMVLTVKDKIGKKEKAFID